jgi:hypothetical protein
MNSSIEIADAITILEKLIDRTREGRLSWQATEDGYSTKLEPNLKVKISDYESDGGETEFWRFELIEFDPRGSGDFMGSILGLAPDKEVIHVTAEKSPSYGYGTIQEKNLTDLLANMSALARRSALDLNSSMKRALTYLDKIAG